MRTKVPALLAELRELKLEGKEMPKSLRELRPELRELLRGQEEWLLYEERDDSVMLQLQYFKDYEGMKTLKRVLEN